MRATALAPAVTSAGRPVRSPPSANATGARRCELGRACARRGRPARSRAGAGASRQGDHRHRVERRPCSRARRAARAGRRSRRRAPRARARSPARCAAACRGCPGSDTPCRCSPTAPRASPRDQRRQIVGADSTPTARLVCESDDSAAITSAVQRSTFVPAATSSSAMRSLPRSSSTNASTGAMPAAERGAQRVLALVDEETRALALLGLAERARGLDAAVGAARDHAGTPLSAATGAQAG